MAIPRNLANIAPHVNASSTELVVNDGGANLDFRVEGDTDANLLFVDASAEAVGIGTSSPSCRADIVGPSGATRGIVTRMASDNGAYIQLVDSGSHEWYVGTPNGTSALVFGDSRNVSADGTERARITSDGSFYIGQTSSVIGSAAGSFQMSAGLSNNIAAFTNTNSTGNIYGPVIYFSGQTPDNTTSYFLVCADPTNEKCFIYSSGTISNRTGTYNTISDLKLKQDIVDANSQWDDIKALRIVKYRLKDEVAADPNYPSYIGVIAQEVEQVSPGLIDNCPDFENVEIEDEEGNITTERRETGTVTKSVKSSIIYMKAVKALQEAMERIETLEAKVAALENQP